MRAVLDTSYCIDRITKAFSYNAKYKKASFSYGLEEARLNFIMTKIVLVFLTKNCSLI